MDAVFKARNPFKYYSRGEFWEQYKISGRCQETADQRERRDFLNVAWQILKELEGEGRPKSEEGAYFNYSKASINDKADRQPPTGPVHLQRSHRGKDHRPDS